MDRLKIFLLTFTILIAVCFLSLAFMSFSLPTVFIEQMDNSIKKSTNDLVSFLEKSTFEESVEALVDFEKATNSQVYLINSQDVLIRFNENYTYEYEQPIKFGELQGEAQSELLDEIPQESFVDTQKTEESNETINKDFYFSDDTFPYTLLIQTSPVKVNQLAMAISKIVVPMMLSIIILALIISYFYARYILKMKIYNEKLQEDIEKERAYNEQRSLLFMGISHELKTPITIIRGQLESMLVNIGDYKNRDKYLKHSLDVTVVLENKIKDITMLSRMDSSDFNLNTYSFDLSELVRKSYIEHIALVEQKTFEVNIEIDENIKITADETLIRKAINNLISNACNYSPINAKLEIILNKESLTIFNSDISIEEVNIDRIFEPFYRADKARNYASGTGLGLYLVSKILTAHDYSFNIKTHSNGVLFTIDFK